MHGGLDAVGGAGDDAAGIAAALAHQVQVGKPGAQAGRLPQDLDRGGGLAFEPHDGAGLKALDLAAELDKPLTDGAADRRRQEFP